MNNFNTVLQNVYIKIQNIKKNSMKQKLKPLITLSKINAIPDGHLHSKISYLKSIINEQQNPEALEMKERLNKMSYTVKNIGIRGEDIGITSKRMPLKQKQELMPQQMIRQRQKEVYKKSYLPQNSFYSQPLIAIRKSKSQSLDQSISKNGFLVTSSNSNTNEYPQTYSKAIITKFAKRMQESNKLVRNFSHAINLKSNLKRQNSQREQTFIQNVTTIKGNNSQTRTLKIKSFTNRKSFAKLLNQCQEIRKQVKITPLQHDQNPLFKKIKKIQQSNYQRNEALKMQSQSARGIARNTNLFLGRYHMTVFTQRSVETRNKLSRAQ